MNRRTSNKEFRMSKWVPSAFFGSVFDIRHSQTLATVRENAARAKCELGSSLRFVVAYKPSQNCRSRPNTRREPMKKRNAVTPWRDENSEEVHNAAFGTCLLKSHHIFAGFPPQTDRNDRAKRYLKSTILVNCASSLGAIHQSCHQSTIGSGFAGLGVRCFLR